MQVQHTGAGVNALSRFARDLVRTQRHARVVRPRQASAVGGCCDKNLLHR
jgi:hypothetical protein